MAYSPPLPGQTITPTMLNALAGPWQSYVPTLTGTTIGNGSLITRYQQSANRIIVGFSLNWGSTTTGNMPILTLPATPASLGGMRWTGNCTINPGGGGSFRSGWAVLSDSATTISTYAVTSTAALTSSFTTASITMQSGGWIMGSIEYEF